MTDLKKLAGYQFDVKSRRFRLILPPGEWVRYSDYVALQQEVETLRRERDLAVAHDRQPYPTADAYEAVCAALHKCKERLASHEEMIVEMYKCLQNTGYRHMPITDDLARILKQRTVEDGETKP